MGYHLMEYHHIEKILDVPSDSSECLDGQVILPTFDSVIAGSSMENDGKWKPSHFKSVDVL